MRALIVALVGLALFTSGVFCEYFYRAAALKDYEDLKARMNYELGQAYSAGKTDVQAALKRVAKKL